MLQKTIYIETYGCSANQNNSEILAGILAKAGHMVTNNEKLAEIIIINSCVVKGKTESKIRRKIQDLSKQNKLLILSGCMPQTDAKKLTKLNKNMIFLGAHHTKDILNIIKDYQENKLDKKKQEHYLDEEPEEKLILPKTPQNKLISITQISEGCLGECSYCKTRLAKGRLFTYPEEDIIKNIENDLQNGAKEVWLTSQDCAAYGLGLAKLREALSKKPLGVLDQDCAAYRIEKGKHKLPELLREILKLKHKFKLRLGMSDPNNIIPILEDLIEVFKDKKIYKFLHIPIQSASDIILKDMNRYYKIEQVEKIINSFKKEFPEIVIATDIIVGYPTEKEEHHKENVKFIKNFKPDVLNISKFSSHKETPAGKLKILSNNIIKKRTTELMQIHRETSKQNKEKYLGKEIEVFINRKVSENLYEARDENYNIVLIRGDKMLLGKSIKVKIIEIGVHHLIGKDVLFLDNLE